MISTSFLSFLLISCSPVMAAPDSATKAAATPPITVGAVVYHEWTHFEAPTALGAIDLPRVNQEIKSRLAELTDCYDRRLAKQPALSGDILIHWTIDTEGKSVHSCMTKDTVQDDGLRACVNSLVMEGTFPAPADQPVDVSLPLTFTSPT